MIKKLVKESVSPSEIATKLSDCIVDKYNNEPDWYLTQVLEILKNPNFIGLVQNKARRSNSLI